MSIKIEKENFKISTLRIHGVPVMQLVLHSFNPGASTCVTFRWNLVAISYFFDKKNQPNKKIVNHTHLFFVEKPDNWLVAEEKISLPIAYHYNWFGV